MILDGCLDFHNGQQGKNTFECYIHGRFAPYGWVNAHLLYHDLTELFTSSPLVGNHQCPVTFQLTSAYSRAIIQVELLDFCHYFVLYKLKGVII
jgi:hypothetical protein